MPIAGFFRSLSPGQLQQNIAPLEPEYQLVAVTLLDGDILLGALEALRPQGNDFVFLAYNSDKGKRFGESKIAEIPVTLIANTQQIPLTEESSPKPDPNDPTSVFLREAGFESLVGDRLRIRDYPNPLASIIYTHNSSVACKYGLSVQCYFEKTLSRDAVPARGIEFDDDFILYADWAFFSQRASGAVAVGISLFNILNVEKDFNPSLHDMVMRGLRKLRAESVREKTHNGVHEKWVVGHIFVPDPIQSTELEGEECIVVTCVESSNLVIPVLLKPALLRFPYELLYAVTSPLVFYGEVYPIPIAILDETYKEMLLVRAIGYLV